jgi:hypothetical protein
MCDLRHNSLKRRKTPSVFRSRKESDERSSSPSLHGNTGITSDTGDFISLMNYVTPLNNSFTTSPFTSCQSMRTYVQFVKGDVVNVLRPLCQFVKGDVVYVLRTLCQFVKGDVVN